MMSKYNLWLIFNLISGIVIISSMWLSIELLIILNGLPIHIYEPIAILMFCILFGGSIAQYLIVKSRECHNYYCDKENKLPIPDMLYDAYLGPWNIAIFVITIALSYLWAIPIGIIPMVLVIIGWRMLLGEFHTIVELAEKIGIVK